MGDAYMVAFGLMPEVRDDEDPSLVASRRIVVSPRPKGVEHMGIS